MTDTLTGTLTSILTSILECKPAPMNVGRRMWLWLVVALLCATLAACTQPVDAGIPTARDSGAAPTPATNAVQGEEVDTEVDTKVDAATGVVDAAVDVEAVAVDAGVSAGVEAVAATDMPSDPEERALAYSRCMRENGVPDFPDPDPEGRIMLRVSPNSSLHPDSREFQQASEACRHLQPEGRRGDPNGPGGEETMLAFARCMRENGVEEFPDPDPNASGPGIRIQIGPESGINPNDPQVEVALETCNELLRGEAIPRAQR